MTLLRRSRLVLVARLLVALGLAVAITLTIAPRSSAQADLVFAGQAVAQGVSASLRVEPAIATAELVDLSAPIASASLDSLGNGAALASLPYTGDFVASLPGLLPLLGVGPPTFPRVPDYPLVVQASAGAGEHGRLDAGAYTLQADSQATGSKAVAGLGATSGPDLNAARSRSTASVGVSDGALATSAESIVSALAFGPLRLGEVRTFARATGAAGADLKLEAGFEIAGATVSGQGIQFSGRGITVLGTTVPLDSATITPVIGALFGDIAKVEYLPEARTADSITAAGLRITRQVSLGFGTATVTTTLGRAFVKAAVSQPAARSADQPALDTAAAPSAGVPTSAGVVATPDLGGLAPTPSAVPPTVSVSPGPATRLTATTGQLPADLTGWFYPLLVVTFVVVLGISQLLRLLGVRYLWT